MSLQGGVSAKDVEIARLKEQVAQLTEERDLWRARAQTSDIELKNTEKKSGCNRFIVISAQKLRSVLTKIHDVKILSVVAFILQKALPDTVTSEECKTIAEIVPLPQLPNLTLTAEGDVNVEGDWQDVHDNQTVNF